MLGRGVGKKAMCWLLKAAEARGLEALYGQGIGQ